MSEYKELLDKIDRLGELVLRLESKVDTIIRNTNKKKRVLTTGFEENALIDRILEYWKVEFNKPKLKIASEGHRKPIRARIREGYKFEDFVTVIEKKKKDSFFINNPQYFLPSTLFGTKFDLYLNADEKKKVVDKGQAQIISNEAFFDTFNEAIDIRGK